MKMKLLFLTVILLVFQTSFAQSVRITSKKITYKRPQPIAEDKKFFTVNYPQVRAASDALSKLIENSVSFEKNMGLRLRDEMGAEQWLEEADFSVEFNKKGVLCINLSMTGTGAFESSFYKSVVVDLKTGKSVRPVEVFTKIGGLLSKIKEIKVEEIEQGTQDLKNDFEYSDEKAAELFRYTDFKAFNLEGFSVNEYGVTFFYDYGFPRLIREIQPSGVYYLSWREIKPYIKRGGLLAGFVR
jgi:hypothetical protein